MFHVSRRFDHEDRFAIGKFPNLKREKEERKRRGEGRGEIKKGESMMDSLTRIEGFDRKRSVFRQIIKNSRCANPCIFRSKVNLGLTDRIFVHDIFILRESRERIVISTES